MTESPIKLDWNGPDDPENPQNFAPWRKWLMVLIVSFSSLCVTCTSALYSSTYDQITVQFHISELAATVGLSLFIFGMGVGPMFVAPISEYYGRRPIYLVSLALFTIWLIPCATAQNLATMLAGRMLGGLTSAAFQSVAGGTIRDLYTRETLQLPMMIYTATPFAGPVLGPLVGGFINSFASWRWSFYTIIIWSSSLFVATIIFMKETYAPVILHKRALLAGSKNKENENFQQPTASIQRDLVTSMYRPFLLLLCEPMCLCLCIYTALLIGTLYLFFGAFPLVFSNTWGFNLWQVGLTFLGQLVGTIIGVFLDPFFKRNLQRLINKHEYDGDSFPPEFRLPPAIIGAPLITISLFWFAWSSTASVHWIMPMIGSSFFGLGVFLAFQGIITFLVDAYPLYAASALAANAFLRSSFAAVFPLFGVQMYEALGYRWATSLLAFLTVPMLPFPYIFFKYGERIRKNSRFADPASR
ncbi:major facilitator superfamily domain-containing protein [Talaromyces proteolyticus]|uniref:Major facilitator superfamily domain-containing protein n=1 Tax=Talaromyces proteolyticus TaxID=1131652 RepID=A0AAD4Q5Q7_9EURO|nr:major facilitator superfamily domain-containing protein [Talaromyces proteolyticus]KAH8704225.1 major facilitator superfamily domain-containing protein [Talaromyces proteolyticus]